MTQNDLDTVNYGSLLRCMFGWGRQEEVILLISEYLSAPLSSSASDVTPSKRSTKRTKTGRGNKKSKSSKSLIDVDSDPRDKIAVALAFSQNLLVIVDFHKIN